LIDSTKIEQNAKKLHKKSKSPYKTAENHRETVLSLLKRRNL